ncbi:histidine phosphatase family protein [Nocardioides sp. SYSU D00038]|uniref:histidine phosphatase family protein n=1 Tax=Nocardioides sp. SYSU D00038 TaxID=2812554 RepID=UPI001967AF4A|nr:histidine phosphatase family protein [Nocardioides sp. SYSU D00038]
MTRRLILARHGRTAWNHAKRVQGQLDAELDETGHAQAERLAACVAPLRPDVLWSSDLTRAAVTASYVAAATGLEVRTDPRLRECDLGPRQGLTHDEYAALAPEEFAQFRLARYDAVPGAEPTVAVRARMTAAVADLLAAVPPGGLGVAVSHGAALRMTVAALLGWPDPALETLGPLGNCGWLELVEHPHSDGLALTAYNRTPDFASRGAVG